jgi:transposase
MDTITYVGLDVHKATISVAVAESGRGGEIRQVGVFENRPEVLMKLAARLGKAGRRLSFCYEAGPCGYGLHRLLAGCGHDCVVVAPSLIPIKAGDGVKTDRRDALMLAKLHRAGALTPIWIPDAAHEARRDLVRARATARKVLSKARQHLQGFLLRHERVYRGARAWTLAYRRWLTTVRFTHPAQQIVLQDYIHAVGIAAELVDGAGGRGLAGDARGCAGRRRDRRRRGRRFSPLCQGAAADGLSRAGPFRAFLRK